MGRPRKLSGGQSKSSVPKRQRKTKRQGDSDSSTDTCIEDKNYKGHATQAQRERLLLEMEKDFCLFNGEYHNMSEDKQEEKNNAWNMLARELNAMEKYKPPKTSQEWIKTWKGMQSHAKKAATKIKKDVDETGGGPGSGAQLTSRQERIIALIAPRVRGILQKGANCSTVLGAVHDHKYANLSKMIHDRIADAQIESDSSNFSYNSSDEENSISDNSVPNEIPANQSLNTAFPAFPKTAKINRVENKASGPSYANPTPGPSFANTAADHYANPTPGPSFANTAADHYANPTPGPSFANTAADHYANPTPGPSFANTAADHYANPTPGPSFANTAADHYVNPTPGSSSCKTATKPSCVAPIPGSSNVKTISSRTLSCSGSYNGQKSVIKRNQQYGKTRSPFGNTSSRVTKMTTNNNEPRISFAFSGGNDKRSDPCTASKVTSPTKEEYKQRCQALEKENKILKNRIETLEKRGGVHFHFSFNQT